MKKYGTKLVLIMALAFFSCAGKSSHKNVILIIPDGCSITLWASIRAITVGTDSTLNIDRMPIQGRCRTYAANAMITDSAAAATAYACGVKTNAGVIGMDAETVLGDSLTGQPIETILEAAHREGYATGLVTTTTISHATPAAFYSHRANRSWYELISSDLLNAHVDVIMAAEEST
jgi:alkaline phosphatase